jgi:hypothetical protein
MRSTHLFVLGLGLLAACNGKDTGDTNTDSDSGEDLAGDLLVDCTLVDFGNVEVNSISSATIKAQNNGAGELVIDNITIEAPFLVSATTPIPVSSGSSYQFTVRFHPEDFGVFTGTMTVEWSTGGEAQAPFTCDFSGSVTDDADNDGYVNVDAGGDDCDDDDPAVNPGATESWYDGFDQNCDGVSDFDQDGDGYESKVFNEDPSAGGGDCQDVDPTINPDATDIPYDGVDTDCSGGSDFDQDGDGYSSADYGGTDCNDDESTVNPVATETFDGLDNDCDGVNDDGATADGADVLIMGANADDGAGNSVAVSDFDNDGNTDLIVGVWYYNYAAATGTSGVSQGAVAVFMNEGWTDGDDVTNGDNYLEGANAKDEFGYAVADLGDIDADGYNDLGVSAPAYSSKYGRVYVYSGADIETTSTTSASYSYTGQDDYRLGMGMMTDTDINGDGSADVVMLGVNSWNVYNYLAIEYGGGVAGNATWDDIDATFYLKCGDESTTSSAPYCGPPAGSGTQGGSETWAYSTGKAQDIDGDGYVDLLLGDQYNDDGAKQAGKAYVLWGKSSKYTAANASLSGYATSLAEGDHVQNFIGKSVGVVPDANGDGAAEILIQDGDTDDMYFVMGSSDLKLGNLDLSADADATIAMPGDTITGWSQIGDWSGDGTEDFAVSFGEDGEVWMFATTAWSGTVTASTSIMGSLIGGDTNDAFGYGIAPVGYDMNGDGAPDLAVGDNGYDSGKGSLHLFYQP